MKRAARSAMTRRKTAMIRTALLSLAAALIPLSAAAQSPVGKSTAYAPPRTASGHPDFQGVWENRWLTPVERGAGPSTLSVTAEQAATLEAAMTAGRRAAPGNTNPDSDFDLVSLARVGGEYRTSLIVDPANGKLPLTDEGRARRTRLSRQLADNPEERVASERCIAGPGRAPMLTVPTNAYLEFIQPPGMVVIHSEALDDVRILPLNGQQRPPAVLTMQGHSMARWEGDTLVVETRNFRRDDELRFSPPFSVIIISPETVVTERFTRVSDDEINYRFTIVDPTLYTGAWTAETSFTRTKARLYEYACHEANYAMTNMLLGQRIRDQRAAAQPVAHKPAGAKAKQ
jgi:hypothetical protein